MDIHLNKAKIYAGQSQNMNSIPINVGTGN